MTSIQWRLIGFAALLLLIGTAFVGVYQSGYNSGSAAGKAEVSSERESQATTALVVTEDNRTEEQRRQTAFNQVGSDAREQSKAATADVAGADASGDRVHIEAHKLAASVGKCTSDPGVTERGLSAARAAMVLSELLDRADKAAGELAAVYDQSRIAGQTCLAAYSALTNRLPPPP